MNDVPEIIRAFYPYISGGEDKIFAEIFEEEGSFGARVFSTLSDEVYEDSISVSQPSGSLLYKKFAKRLVKNLLYKYCSRLTGVTLPYGSLTGVRPTKLWYELAAQEARPAEVLEREFFVTPEKASLIGEVVANQRGVYDEDGEGADIFVNIPICPTRCKYCSFISAEIGRVRKHVPLYIECLEEEIAEIKAELSACGKKVRSVYVGGGTPTSISPEELKRVCSLLSFGGEFTVEAGRPDSITPEKLAVLKECEVTRVSVNPQTFKDETLVLIGRAHRTEDFFRAYEAAKSLGFDVNADLIAGLPGESLEDFLGGLKRLIALRPENITIHALSLKRGAELRLEGARKDVSGLVRAMTGEARAMLSQTGYGAYYMYRQKDMADNVENVGYCLKGKQCVYNIDYMEETNDIFSAGAGAMSKRVSRAEGRVERIHNPKGFEEYLRRRGKLK